MTAPSRLSLKTCYSNAWKSFAKWWIPICLLAGVLMVFQLGPKQLAKVESVKMRQTLDRILSAYEQNDLVQMEEIAIELNEALLAYTEKLMRVVVYVAPIAAVLAVLLICTSLMAVEDRRTKYAPRQIILVSIVHLILAVAKMLLLFIVFPLGLFIYVKLFFVSLLMLDEETSPSDAIKGSWKMTSGHFWPLLGMVGINGIYQFALAPTIVGLIPATGFASTARAAAYSALRESGATSQENV